MQQVAGCIQSRQREVSHQQLATEEDDFPKLFCGGEQQSKRLVALNASCQFLPFRVVADAPAYSATAVVKRQGSHYLLQVLLLPSLLVLPTFLQVPLTF
jgi:hypothetical protein